MDSRKIPVQESKWIHADLSKLMTLELVAVSHCMAQQTSRSMKKLYNCAVQARRGLSFSIGDGGVPNLSLASVNYFMTLNLLLFYYTAQNAAIIILPTNQPTDQPVPNMATG